MSSNDSELRENYCFWCSVYGKNNEPYCMGCGHKIGSIPPEVEALIQQRVRDGKIGSVERVLGAYERLSESAFLDWYDDYLKSLQNGQEKP